MVRFAFTPAHVFVARDRQTAAKLRRQGYAPVWTEETAAKWMDIRFAAYNAEGA